MTLAFIIGGVDRTSLVQVSSLSISDTLNSRNTAEFTLVDVSGTNRPVIGSSIVINNGATRIFGGSIESYDEDELTPGIGPGLVYAIKCVDFNQLCDRFEVAEAYSATGQTLRDIVLDLVSTYLVAEGITTTNVATGPAITSAVWNYLPLATAFNDLADLAGYAWWIDYNKDLHFMPRDGIVAPMALTDASGNFRNMTVSRSRSQYRNLQIVRAGVDLTSVRTDHAAGDGKTRAFTLAYPVGDVPVSIKVNAATKTFGVQGVDTGKDFYYALGSNTITQDNAGALLGTSDDLAVTYQGQFPIILLAQLDGEITTRAAVEGGSGIYQEVESYTNVNSRESAQEIADSLLKKFGTIPVVVKFETDVDGLFSGQLLPITNTAHALAGSFLVSKVSFSDFSGQGDLRYQVEAYDGQFLGSWESFFRDIAAIGKKFTIRDNEVVVYLRTAGYLTGVGVAASESLTQNNVFPGNANVGASDSMAAPSFITPESRVGFALASLSETG